jgi:hypothetical protein
MGRYYHGTISGKFWFGIQSSSDPSSFKDSETFIEPTEGYEYYCCGCNVDSKDDLFCSECYSSYEEHYDELDEYTKGDVLSGELIGHLNNNINYSFDESELDFVSNKLIELENEIGIDIISKLNFTIDEENEFEYEIEDIDEINDENKNKSELIARWCLGQQIKKALENCCECNISCEL